jgi:hypothetical protein
MVDIVPSTLLFFEKSRALKQMSPCHLHSIPLHSLIMHLLSSAHSPAESVSVRGQKKIGHLSVVLA